MKAKAHLSRTLLVPPVVVLAAVALFGLGLRTAQPQETQAADTHTSPTNVQVQDLGTLGDNGRYSRAQGINDSGQVVGHSRRNDGHDHAFLYDGTMHDLGTLWDGGSSYAYDINNSGQVVGSSGHAFIYDSTNGMRDLNDSIPGDSSGLTFTEARAINSDGKIVAPGHVLTPITTATPATYEVQDVYGSPEDINDSGKVVGIAGGCVGYWTEAGFCTQWDTRTFLYDSVTQQMQNLGSYGSPTGINDSGKVVAGQWLYDSATQQWQDLGTVGGYSYSRALGINDSDQVVGAVCNTLLHEGTDGSWSYESCHASLKESGQPMIDLNTLLPADSGWTIEEATAINSDGKIAATGSKAGVGTHALLLTPTSDSPPPADTQAPSPPTITGPQTNTYDSDGSFSVSGGAEAASTVELFEGTTSKGTIKADSSTGAWSIALSGVSEGAHTYSTKAKDAAGNTSSASNSVTVTVDKTAPKVNTLSATSVTSAGVPLRKTDFKATFSEKMDTTTLATPPNAPTFKLFKCSSTTSTTCTTQITDAPVTPSADGLSATLNPFGSKTTSLQATTRYKVVITTGAKDVAGNALDQDSTTTGNQQKVGYFTTGSS